MLQSGEKSFSAKDQFVDILLSYPLEKNNRSIKAKTLNLSNQGACIETREDVKKYKMKIGEAVVPVSALWGIKEDVFVKVPFRILRTKEIGSLENTKYVAELQFLIFSIPTFSSAHLKSKLTETIGGIARKSVDASFLLQGVLDTVMSACSAVSGILYVRDKSSVKIPLNKDCSVKISSELVSYVWKDLPENYVPPAVIQLDESPETGSKNFNKIIHEKLKDLPIKAGGKPYVFPLLYDRCLRGIIYVLIPNQMQENEIDMKREAIEDTLAAACNMLEIIVDYGLQKNLLELNNKALSTRSISPEQFMNVMLSETRKCLNCSGISFFVRDYGWEISTFSLVATSPGLMPKETITYSLNDLNFTSQVFRNTSPCVLQYYPQRRSEMTNIPKPKWRDTIDDENIASVLFIPIISDKKVMGLLRCTNKTHEALHKYFNAIDLHCAKTFAPLLLTWLIAAQKEHQFTSALLDISHEIKLCASGIKSAARFVENAIEKNPNIYKQDEKQHKLQHIKNTAESLIKLLPALKKNQEVFVKEDIKKGFRPYADLCMSVCETYQTSAKQRNIIFEILGKDQFGLIYANLDDFKHIFQNIIDNAVKYSYEGKKIVVKMQRGESGDEYSMIHVISESLTIRDDEKEEIFKPGYRSVATLKTTADGEGRGLMIARTMARRYHGDIILHNTTPFNVFSILIPKELFRSNDLKP